MGLKPKPSFSTSFLDNLELHPKLKQLLACSLSNRKPPRDLFDNTSYRYYMVYVKPKITMALKNKFVKVSDRYEAVYKKPYLSIYVSPSYLIYRFTNYIKSCKKEDSDCDTHTGSQHYYVFGVDNDNKVFVNRVFRAPTLYDNKIEISPNIELRLVRSDSEFYDVMGYRIDLGDKEEITIDVAGRASVRVQGDIVLIAEPLGESLTGYIHREQIINHMRLLLVDVVNRILLDHGISCIIARDGVLIENIAPRRNETLYQHKIFKLIAKELKELLGDVEIHHDWLLIKSGDFRGFIVSARTRSGGFGNRYNHIAIEITLSNSEIEHNQFLVTLQNEMLKAIENAPFTNTEFTIGNHHVKMFNVKPLSFTYRPNKQPLTIGENIITIINQLTFIVNPKSWVELYHEEHGVKTIRFNNDYVIRFVHVLIDSKYIDERNRIIVRNLEI